MNQWLIRTQKNEIEGPFTKEDVIARILERRLGIEDEVCQANHYWIYLDERSEVIRQLGIEVPRSSREGGLDTDEITLTETTDLSLGERGSESDVPSERERGSRTIPQKPKDVARHSAYPGIPAQMPKSKVAGRAKEGVWRIVGTLLIVVTSGLVIWIIQILQTAK
jgi:hypothetical protein